MEAAPTILRVFAMKMIAFAAERGVPAEPLLAIAGLTPSDLAQPEERMSLAKMVAVWAEVMRALQDPAVPIAIARTFRLEDYHLFGFCVMSSPDGREAIRRVIRYSRLITDHGGWTLREERRSWRLIWRRDSDGSLGYRVTNESAVAELLHGFRQTAGAPDLTPLSVSFRHRAPRDVSAHDAFFGTRCRFEAEEDGLAIPDEVLDLVPRAANPALSAYFEKQAEHWLAASSEEGEGAPLEQQLMRMIAAELASGEPQMAVVAKKLAMSERSLRRALTERGSSFRDLVARVRDETARRLLRSSTSLTEIAFLLGFSEVSAFNRAFKRSTGLTPGEFRRSADAVNTSAAAVKIPPGGSRTTGA